MVLRSSNGIPRVPPYFSLAESITFRLQDSHLLWLAFPCHSSILWFCNSSANQAPPRSLVATSRIVFTFFSCRYWDISIPCVPLPFLGWHVFHMPSCLIRIPTDRRVLTAPLWRFAVSCVLHRCLVPRHSLRAFSSLTLRQNLSTFQRSQPLGWIKHFNG